MKNVDWVRLEDLASIITKGTTPKTLGLAYCNDGIPFLRSEDILGSSVTSSRAGLYISKQTHYQLKRSIIKPGDILITIAGTVGRVGYVPDSAHEMNCNQAVALARVDRKKILPEFACYACSSKQIIESLFQQRTTATISNLSLKQIREMLIPLPPLDEQRRIVGVLEGAARIVRLRRRALETARAVVPALFLDTFGDPATNPKGWEVVRLGEVIAGFQGGKNIQAGDEGTSPFRILKISAITGGVFRPSEAKPAPPGYEPPKEHFVRQGDLLITRANTAELVGAIAQVDNPAANLLLPDKIWRFCWRDPSPVMPAYLQAVMATAAVREELRKMATGTSDSMRNISQQKLLAMPFAVPPLPLQRAFAERVADLRAVIARQERALAAAEGLQGALMARVFG